MITKNEIAVRYIPAPCPSAGVYLREVEAQVTVRLHAQFDPAEPRAKEETEKALKAEFIHKIYGDILHASKGLHAALRETNIHGFTPEVEAAFAKLVAVIPRP